MSRLGVAVIVLVAWSQTASAERPRLEIDRNPAVESLELPPNALLPYNTIYVNRCPSGCPIRVGSPSSITDSWYIGSARTLTAFPYGDAVWAQLMSCIRDVFEPYNVNITDVNPGTANHFEVMVAGAPGDLGMSSGIGGIAPGSSCGGYVGNALVFDFAKVWGSGTTCGQACVEDMCATAAQELGHAWRGLDHVIDNKDPMTYFGYSGRKYFQNNNSQCGSDCQNGTGPNGQTCSGTNNQIRACDCGLTQNSYNIMKDLFGLGPGSPPVVKITSPKLGQSVDPGFGVFSDITDNSGTITKVELRVDGQLVGTLMSPPYVFNAPTTLMNGTHKAEITAYDPHQTAGKASVDVIIGPPCTKPADCSNDTDTCVGGRCVPGSGVPGGLGSPCSSGTECLSGQCASDGTEMYCVEPCMVGQCPSDFGCLETAPEMGVCWPGYDDGSGGCGCQSNRGGAAGMMLLLGWVVLSCRKRRARS